MINSTYLVTGELVFGGVCGLPAAGLRFSNLEFVPVDLVPALDGWPLVSIGSSSTEVKRIIQMINHKPNKA